MKKHRCHTTGAALVASLLALGLLAGCASATSHDSAVPETPIPTGAEGAPSPETISEEIEAPAESSPPEVAADEHSQVVDGVLYQGTPIAPVRIGADAPGSPPEAASRQPGRFELEAFAEAENKYLVYVFYSPSSQGGISKVFGMSRHGSFRQLSMSEPLDSLDAAIAYPPTVDGRVLDRAEYLVFIEG